VRAVTVLQEFINIVIRVLIGSRGRNQIRVGKMVYTSLLDICHFRD